MKERVSAITVLISLLVLAVYATASAETYTGISNVLEEIAEVTPAGSEAPTEVWVDDGKSETLEQAISEVAEGGTVYVAGGPYSIGELLINKSISLKSQDGMDGYLEGKIQIAASNVTIEGLNIEVTGSAGAVAILVGEGYTDVVIQNNEIITSQFGIAVLGDATVAIKNNTVRAESKGTYGILIGSTEAQTCGEINATLEGNNVSGFTTGIFVRTRGTVAAGLFSGKVDAANAVTLGQALEAQATNNDTNVKIVNPDQLDDTWYPPPQPLLALEWDPGLGWTFPAGSPHRIGFTATPNGGTTVDNVVFVMEWLPEEDGLVVGPDNPAVEAGVFQFDPGSGVWKTSSYNIPAGGTSIETNLTFKTAGRYRVKIYAIRE